MTMLPNAENELKKLMKDGLYRQAADHARKILDELQPSENDSLACYAWNSLLKSLEDNNRESEIDECIEKYPGGKFSRDPAFLAGFKQKIPDYGQIVDNVFIRGSHGGHGRYVRCSGRDRVRRLQILAAAVSAAENCSDPVIRGRFFFNLARTLLKGRKSGLAYRLQVKTDLDQLPGCNQDDDREPSISRPPVNPDGTPVFYAVPESFEAAANDGERFRYAVRQAETAGSEDAALLYANFLCEQFDVAAMENAEDWRDDVSRREELYQLKDNETITELADGIRKITLPPDAVYLEIYRKLGYHERRAMIYLGRMQFEKAAEEFRLAGEPKKAADIEASFGHVKNVEILYRGKPDEITYVSRNASKVLVDLFSLDQEKALQTALKLSTTDRWYNTLNEMFRGREQIFGKEKNDWADCIAEHSERCFTLELHPAPHHWNSEEKLKLPDLPCGRIWLARFTPLNGKGFMERDSESFCLIWKSAAFLTSMETENGFRFFLNDSETGKPLYNVPLDIYYLLWKERVPEHPETRIRTGRDGIAEFVFPEKDRKNKELKIVPVARLQTGELVLLSRFMVKFDEPERDEPEMNLYFIQDRPIYRPGDTVHLCAYARIPRYTRPIPLPQKCIFLLDIFNAKERILTEPLLLDQESGTLTYDFKLPDDAETGYWRVMLERISPRSEDGKWYHLFRVEEYKKPEYELHVLTPEKPAFLGKKIRFRLQANYYFGQPLAGGTLKYKVTCREASDFQPFLLKWEAGGISTLYCFTSFSDSGRRFQNFSSFDKAEGTIETDAEGFAEIELDTAGELEKYGPASFYYQIHAELKDASERTVEAGGMIRTVSEIPEIRLGASWNFLRAGIPGRISVAVANENNLKSCTGRCTVYRWDIGLSFADAVKSDPVRQFGFDPADEGFSVTIDQPGRYLLKAEITRNGKTGEYITDIPVFAPDAGIPICPGSKRIQIFPEKNRYQPGDQADILVACSRRNCTVYIQYGTRNHSEIICTEISGFSKLIRIPITEEQQPNLFFRVMTVFGGTHHQEEAELKIPPENKKLHLLAEPDKSVVKPDQTVQLRLRISDHQDKPLAHAPVTVTVYDKALEQLIDHQWIRDLFKTFWGRENSAPPDWDLYSTWLSTGFPNPRDYTEYLESSFSIPFSNDDDERRCYDAELMPAGSARIGSAPSEDDRQDDWMPPDLKIRSEFADRAFWLPCGMTDAEGQLEIPLKLPDNLTTWKIRAWSVALDASTGEGDAEIVVNKDFIVRLELPRFMIRTDQVNAAAIIHNYTGKLQKPQIELTAPELRDTPFRTAGEIVPDGKISFPVELRARETGRFQLRLAAWTADTSDAVELPLPVLERGFDKQINRCGILDPEHRSIRFQLPLPRERRKESTFFTLQFSPGLLPGILELVPYLAAEDSGDVFCSVNRIVPPLTALALLEKLGIDPESVRWEKTERDKLYADYLRQYSLNGEQTPLFDAGQIRESIRKSLKKLADEANPDGGWSWFPGGKSSFDPTAAVVDALLDLNCQVPDNKVEFDNEIEWLEDYAKKRLKDTDLPPGIEEDCTLARILAKAGKDNAALRAACYEHRLKFSPHGIASLALAYDAESEECEKLTAMLMEFLETDPETGTAFLRIRDCYSIFWYGDRNETLAMFLNLLVRNDPHDPLAAKIAQHLLCSLRNSPWRNSIRALGSGLRAVGEYLRKSGEAESEFTLQVSLGARKETFRFTPENMLTTLNRPLILAPEELTGDALDAELTFSGTGRCIWNAMLNYYSLEDRVEQEGLDLRIKRNFYRLAAAEQTLLHVGTGGQVVKQTAAADKRVPLGENEAISSGEILEVELIAEAKNDYDYVVLESPMPAGFEYVSPNSGWEWNWRAPIYRECRERSAKFNLQSMPQGRSTVTYRIRAGLTGRMTALPAQGSGVYAKTLKCNDVITEIQVKK